MMDIQLDPRRSMPLYAQLVEQVRSLVLSGALRPGDRVASVRELASGQRINRNTVAKAYGVLEAEGVLESRRGEGTFVAATPDPRDLQAHRERVDRFLKRVVAEAADLGLSADELTEQLHASRYRTRRAKPA